MIPASAHTQPRSFEEAYLALRRKEGRLFSDEEVLQLPEISKTHPLYAEWCSRKESASRLKHHLRKKRSLLKILDVGCGNGWLCHQLAHIPGCDVTGIDVNFTELQQAARVFSHIPGLRFIHGSIGERAITDLPYDCILFAASIQYFPSLKDTISLAIALLKPGGEIHLLDTHFYTPHEAKEAALRTGVYYDSLGFPEMKSLYFHHSTEELNAFRYETLYQPSFFTRHLLKHKNPFPWFCIKKS